MAEPTLIAVFGAGATQTASTITIQKSALTGLIPTATNSAESLLAGLLNNCLSALTPAAAAINLDQSIVVSRTADTMITLGGSNRYGINLAVTLSKTIQSAGITPDGY